MGRRNIVRGTAGDQYQVMEGDGIFSGRNIIDVAASNVYAPVLYYLLGFYMPCGMPGIVLPLYRARGTFFSTALDWLMSWSMSRLWAERGSMSSVKPDSDVA